MKFRGLDAGGDWQLGQGVGSYAKDADALALDIQTRLLSWKGDCFFALNDGIDYHNRLDKGQQKNLETELSNEIMQTNGVVKINSFTVTLDPKTRAFRATYDVQTVFTKSFQRTISNIAGATTNG